MRHVFKNVNMLLAMAVLFTVMIVGCAGKMVSTEASTSGIRAAEEVGANEIPQAALHLQLAKEELAQAEKLVKDGDKEEAKSMLMRSEADASLALVLSRENAEKLAANEEVERVRKFKQDNL